MEKLFSKKEGNTIIIEINTRGKFTFINQVLSVQCNEKHNYQNGVCTKCGQWQSWKVWETMTDDEKAKVNLGIPSDKYLILDKDHIDPAEIENEWKAFKQKLLEYGITSYVADKSAHGFHVFVPFNKLDDFDEKLAKEIRTYYIRKFECDPAKSSHNGVIALPRRPHFKTMQTYGILEVKDGLNELKEEVIEQAKESLDKKSKNQVTADIDFKDYFEKDVFWKYLNNWNGVIPLGVERNNTIFPNLAVACAKSGKSREEIEEIIKDFLKRKMPDIPFTVFDGWLKKAFSGDIQDYNPIQINNWKNQFTNDSTPLYDLRPISIEEQLEGIPTIEEVVQDDWFITDEELEDEPDEPIEWVVEQWIAKGDICGVVGAFSSFKTTTLLHMCYAIAHGKPVFNKYSTIQSKVLYLNEENHRNLYKHFVRKIKAGLDLKGTKTKNYTSCIMKNAKLENVANIKRIINYVNKNKIELIVFDSFRRFFSGEENKADVMAKIFDTLKFLRTACNNCTILLIHHAKKNNMNGGDDRDMARGSSDFGNSCDSEIMLKRKIGSDTVIMSHIKNRCGPELKGKVIGVEINEEKTYLWETGTAEDIESKKSKPEECAEKIVCLLEDRKLRVFVRSDIKDVEQLYPHDTVTKALRLLKQDNVITENPSSNKKVISYTFNGKFTKKKVVVSDEIDLVDEQTELD